jgi:O-antigen/teichoic acid export membrane protein
LLKRITKKLELDNALLWVLINKFWAVAKGPISLMFIISYLTPEEQGLWYTFLSLGALTVFAEMGFTAIITQFVSHEYAHLKERNGFFKGNYSSRDKLVSLVRYALKFYLIVVPFAIVILYFVGKYFLVDVDSGVFLLWMIFSITGGVQLLVSLLQHIIQGFDKVALVQKNIFIGSLVTPFLSWTLLYLDFGLSTLVIANIVSIILMLALLYLKTKKIFFQISRHKVKTKFKWFNEIVKLQLKYAVSWMAGYFVFQYMTPMIYKHQGAVLAGQFGLTLGLIKTISGISGSWLDTKVPKINIFVAKKDRKGLDTMFNKNALLGFCIFIILSIVFLSLIYLINIYDFYAERFLPLNLAFLIILLEIPNVITGYLAKYLRAHKAEPYYVISAMMGIFFFFIISLLGSENYDIERVILLLNIVSWFVILPLAIYIFKKFKLNYYRNENVK